MTLIPGTDGAVQPFFSPDGKWLGFFTGGQLKKVSLEGVGPVTLADAPGARGGGFWAPDGTIIFPGSRRSGLVKVSADGGAPEVLTTLEPKTGDVAHFWPELLPDGKGILFMLYDGSGLVDWQRIVVQSLELGERRVLARGCGPRYVPTGHLVFARAQTLYAVPFDLDRLEVKGTEVPVVSGVWTPGPYVGGRCAFSISETGTLVYVPSAPVERRLFLVDLDGKDAALPAPPRPYEGARFSPDGPTPRFDHGRRQGVSVRAGKRSHEPSNVSIRRRIRNRVDAPGNGCLESRRRPSRSGCHYSREDGQPISDGPRHEGTTGAFTRAVPPSISCRLVTRWRARVLCRLRPRAAPTDQF